MKILLTNPPTTIVCFGESYLTLDIPDSEAVDREEANSGLLEEIVRAEILKSSDARSNRESPDESGSHDW